MGRKNDNDIGRRTWNIVRLALLWARKGGVFKRRLMSEVAKFLKSLGHTTTTTPRTLFHRQLSFDKTPIIHLKMHRPASIRFNIPCISFTPQVDFDYDFDGRTFFEEDERILEEEKEIDLRAEEFIAKFYEQIKLQRQISYLQYNETPNRSLS